MMSNLTLRRSDLLKLVDMPARSFDAMLQRSQTPWSPRDSGRTWGEFSTEDAYRVALAYALVKNGRAIGEAGAAIRSEFPKLLSVKSSDLGDLLLGTFITETLPSEEDRTRLHLSVLAPESTWLAEMARIKALVAENDTLMGFFAVNASAVMRRTLAKARAADLIDARLLKLAAKLRAACDG